MKTKISEFLNQLRTPDECMELIREAHRRAVELEALKYKTENEVENELWKVLVAYEKILSEKNHRKTAASRTRQMIKRYGIILTAEKAVDREVDPMGYKLLAEKGLENLTFEAIIAKFPEAFNFEAVKKAKMRLDATKN